MGVTRLLNSPNLLARSETKGHGLIELSKSFRDNYARVMAAPHSGQRTWGQGTPRSWGILLPHLEHRHSPPGPRRKPPMPPPPVPRPPPVAPPPDFPPPRLCIFHLQYLRARLPRQPSALKRSLACHGGMSPGANRVARRTVPPYRSRCGLGADLLFF
jgi:hypothetical protein